MAEAESLDVGYARPPRLPAGLFAVRFVTLGAINLLVGGIELLAGTATLVFMAAVRLSGKVHTSQIPFDVVVMSLFAVACGALISSGSVGSFWRLARARTWVRAGLAGDLVVNAVASAAMAFHAGPFEGVVLPGWVMAVAAARVAYVAVALYCYTDVRAEFYFKPDGPLPAAATPVRGRAAAEILGGRALTPLPGARFEVIGTDVVTGVARHLFSRAPTAELARKSALAMGMAADGMGVRAVTPPDDRG